MVTCVKVTNQNYVTFEVKLSSRQSPKVQILTAQTAKDYSEKKNRSKLPKNAKKKKRNLTQIVLCCLKVLFYFFPFLPLNSLVFDTPKRQCRIHKVGQPSTLLRLFTNNIWAFYISFNNYKALKRHIIRNLMKISEIGAFLANNLKLLQGSYSIRSMSKYPC